jgi:hypothetical protein
MDTLAYVKCQDYIASRVFVSADSEKREMRDSSGLREEVRIILLASSSQCLTAFRHPDMLDHHKDALN